jgi:hypothetical protein
VHASHYIELLKLSLRREGRLIEHFHELIFQGFALYAEDAGTDAPRRKRTAGTTSVRLTQ